MFLTGKIPYVYLRLDIDLPVWLKSRARYEYAIDHYDELFPSPSSSSASASNSSQSSQASASASQSSQNSEASSSTQQTGSASQSSSDMNVDLAPSSPPPLSDPPSYHGPNSPVKAPFVAKIELMFVKKVRQSCSSFHI